MNHSAQVERVYQGGRFLQLAGRVFFSMCEAVAVRRATLIWNAKAGAGASASLQSRVAMAFSTHGYHVDMKWTTEMPGSATVLASQAAGVSDLVIACGGDGTVHEVLQGSAGTRTPMGLLPLGTANALARNLRLPLDPVAAVDVLLGFVPQAIPLGYADTRDGGRWFAVMAGAGPDGALLKELRPRVKALLGRNAYYAEAARLFLTRRFPSFEAHYRIPGSSSWERRTVVAVMSARVPDLGGVFRGVSRMSHFHAPFLSVQLVGAPAHVSLPAWVILGRSGLGRANRWLTTLEVEELRCVALPGAGEAFAQVDGELVGSLPLAMRVIPDAVVMLLPKLSQ